MLLGGGTTGFEREGGFIESERNRLVALRELSCSAPAAGATVVGERGTAIRPSGVYSAGGVLGRVTNTEVYPTACNSDFISAFMSGVMVCVLLAGDSGKYETGDGGEGMVEWRRLGFEERGTSLNEAL